MAMYLAALIAIKNLDSWFSQYRCWLIEAYIIDQTNLMMTTAMVKTPKVANVIFIDSPTYERGRGLYNELSTNIHTYGKTYNLKNDN